MGDAFLGTTSGVLRLRNGELHSLGLDATIVPPARPAPRIRNHLPMDVFNLLAEQDWDHENDRPGYRHRRTVIGERLGAALLGGSLYELAPGEKTWPYHYETGCEEWLIAVSGRPTLRGHDGERELTPGDVAVFPEGPAGGHQVINRSDDLCRVLILSSKSPLAVVHYPDSGKVGLWTQAEGYQAMLKTEPKLDYWDGET